VNKPNEKDRRSTCPFLFRVVPRAGLEPARIAPHAPQTCAATNYATSATCFQTSYLLAGAVFEAALAGISTFAGAAAFTFASVAELVLAAVEFVFESAGTSAGASGLAESTETLPVIAGIEIRRAERKKIVAAPIVNFDNIVAVPRGPNAALDILLVNRAPASVLPGCSNTAATRTTQEAKKIVYKM
jgi:hypothetical protein